jgi:hypothetical protein
LHKQQQQQKQQQQSPIVRKQHAGAEQLIPSWDNIQADVAACPRDEWI